MILALLGQVPEAERRIEERLPRLASEDPAERDRAGVEILALGLDALDVLERPREYVSPEVEARAQALVTELRGLEGGVYGEPVVVAIRPGSLDYSEVVEDLCRQVPWGLEIRRSAAGALVEGLEPRSLPFFEAVDVVARRWGVRLRYAQEPPVAEDLFEPRAPVRPCLELPGRRGLDLPVVYRGPVRIAVEAIEQERTWGGVEDRWEVRIFYSVAWQPNVRPYEIENLVDAAETDAGEPLSVREADRRGPGGMRCVVLAGRGAAEQLRLAGRVRFHVADVLARGRLERADLVEGAQVRLGAYAFTVRGVERHDRDVASFRLAPAVEGLLDSAEMAWARWVESPHYGAFRIPAELVETDGGREVRVRLPSGVHVRLDVGIVLRSRAVDHPYDWDLPYPALWPGSE